MKLGNRFLACFSYRPMAFLVLVAATIATLPAAAQQGASAPSGSVPQIVDRSLGEEEQILKRAEWFFESRRAGTSSASEMARLRYEAVEATRSAIQLQQQKRATAGGTPTNFWVPKGPSPSTFGGWSFGNVAGRMSSLAADWAGGVLYAGTASGGVWKSINDGLSWTAVFDTAGTQTIGTVSVDPNDPNVVWVGTGENHQGCESYFGIGILRSPDAGASWELRNGTGGSTIDGLASFANILIDPRDSDHIVTGGRIRGCEGGSQADGGIFTTADGGLTWTERLGGAQVHELAQDSIFLDVFWAATDNGIYKSSDNGVSWTLQTASGLPTNAGRTELAIAPSNGTVYALFDGAGDSFWRTTNGGASWEQRGGDACDGQCWYNMVIRVDPNDPDTIYRGTIRVFKSTNGGTSWTDLIGGWGSSQDVHQDIHHLLMDPNNANTFYVGGDGGLWKSSNGGQSFSNKNGNMNITQFYAVGTDAQNPENVICGGAQDNSSLVRSTSNVWDLQQVTGDGFVCHINPINNDYAYITSYPWSGYPAVLRSTSGIFGGFQQVTGAGSGIIGGQNTNWVTPYIIDPVSPNILYVGTQRVYRSTNNGTSWTPQEPSDMTGSNGSLKVIEVNRNYPTYVYAGSSNGRIWRTENSGETWAEITTGLPSGRSINDVAGHPIDPDRAFAVIGGFNTAHLWEWTQADGWTARGDDLPNVPANSVLVISENDIMVGTDTGVFRSSDGGVTFTPYMDGFPQGTVVTDLKLDLSYDLLTAGTYGRGAWQVTLDPALANVKFEGISLPLTPEDGDGDYYVEPGETVLAEPVLRNFGGQPAIGLQARLSTSTPGVTIAEPSTISYGDLAAGASSLPATPFRIIIDPTFPCGSDIVFDIVDITSTNDPGTYPDVMHAFSVSVVDYPEFLAPVNILEEGFDEEAPSGWTRQAVRGGRTVQGRAPGWQLELASEGRSTGQFVVGGVSGLRGQAWLHQGGTDSAGGSGFELPGDVKAVQLAVRHRYEIGERSTGARVVIDAVADGRDDYVPLKHNGPDRKKPFRGSSGGWVTSVFDLTKYQGQRVWIGFVYESDGPASTEEIWAVDQVEALFVPLDDPVCDITKWPGSVPPTIQMRLVGSDTIEATWQKSCNLFDIFLQKYALHVGDLDLLQATGTYSHAPLEGDCIRTSPETFAAGPGNEYYLVVPNGLGREGGFGDNSSSEDRPQMDATCGLNREAQCP